MTIQKDDKSVNEYRVTNIYKQPNPPEGKDPETPHIAVLKNANGYTLVYLVENTLISDLSINDIILFKQKKPHRGTNSAINVSSKKELYLVPFAENISEDEIKSDHLPSFPN